MTGPLRGRRVVVPRAEGSDTTLLRLLADAGAVALSVPLIAIEPPADPAPLDQAISTLADGGYDWIGFTSANAVRAVIGRSGGDRLRVPRATRIAAVGPATATAVRAAGLVVDLVPASSGGAADLLAAWPEPAAKNATVLLPSSAIGAPTLADGLRERGYRVDRVDAYTTVPASIPPELLADLRAGTVAAVLLTSGSTATSLAAQATPDPTVLIGCIGPSTAAAADTAGLAVGFVASEATAAGLVAGLVGALADQSPPEPVHLETGPHPAGTRTT